MIAADRIPVCVYQQLEWLGTLTASNAAGIVVKRFPDAEYNMIADGAIVWVDAPNGKQRARRLVAFTAQAETQEAGLMTDLFMLPLPCQPGQTYAPSHVELRAMIRAMADHGDTDLIMSGINVSVSDAKDLLLVDIQGDTYPIRLTFQGIEADEFIADFMANRKLLRVNTL